MSVDLSDNTLLTSILTCDSCAPQHHWLAVSRAKFAIYRSEVSHTMLWTILTQSYLPWSVCTCSGVPNLTMYSFKNACATVRASWSGNATASVPFLWICQPSLICSGYLPLIMEVDQEYLTRHTPLVRLIGTILKVLSIWLPLFWRCTDHIVHNISVL